MIKSLSFFFIMMAIWQIILKYFNYFSNINSRRERSVKSCKSATTVLQKPFLYRTVVADFLRLHTSFPSPIIFTKIVYFRMNCCNFLEKCISLDSIFTEQFIHFDPTFLIIYLTIFGMLMEAFDKATLDSSISC